MRRISWYLTRAITAEIPYRFGWNPVSRVYKKGREVWSKRPVVED